MFKTVIPAAMSLRFSAFAALAFVATISSGASARDNRFFLPANDGYGLAECLDGNAACGRVVADAWCEAKGFKAAEAFGRAEPAEITASVSLPARSRAPVFVVTCTD